VDLAEVARAAVAAAVLVPGVRVSVRLDATPPILGRADQLQLALEHLLRNVAEAFEREPGADGRAGDRRVEIRLTAERGRPTLAVAANGPGVPPSLLPHVFEPFSSEKSIATGLGLGLAIVKDIVTRHRGEVAIESSPAGTTVRLAFEPAAEPAVGLAA